MVVLLLAAAGAVALIVGGVMWQTAKQREALFAPAKPAARVASAPPTPIVRPPGPMSVAQIEELLNSQPTSVAVSTAGAGPAVLTFDAFSADPSTGPLARLKLDVPQIPGLEAAIDVRYVLDAAKNDHYERPAKGAHDPMRAVSLRPDGRGRLQGIRRVRLTAATRQEHVQGVEGTLQLTVPVGVQSLNLGADDVGQEKRLGSSSFTLLSLRDREVVLRVTGPAAEYMGAQALSRDDLPVSEQSSNSTASGEVREYSLRFPSPVAKLRVTAASRLITRSYPFVLVR